MANEPDARDDFDFSRFPGFPVPQHTGIPDVLIDHIMPYLSASEFKVIIYLCRKTFGYGKLEDAVSINQMVHGSRRRDGSGWHDEGTGLSRSSVIRAVQTLREKGLIEVRAVQHPSGEADVNVYSLRLDSGTNPPTKPVSNPQGGSVTVTPPLSQFDTGVVSKSDQGSVMVTPRGSVNLTPTRTTIQEQLDTSSSAGELADQLLVAIGQSKPSQEGRRRCLEVCQRLLNGDVNVNGEGYTEDEIRAAIAIAAERKAHSPKYLEHIIGEAVGKLEVSRRRTKQQQSLELQVEADQAKRKDAYEASLAKLAALSRRDYDTLRQRAVDRLGGRQLPEPAIKGLMIGLLERGL